MKRALYPLAGSIFLLAALSASPQEGSKVQLRAATAGTKENLEVRIRWTMQKGWIPTGGFNLYRVDEQGKQKLNEKPLKPNSDVKRSLRLAPDREIDVTKLLGTARLTIRGGRPEELDPFGMKMPRAASSEPVFRAIRDEIVTLRSRSGPRVTEEELTRQIKKIPTVQLHVSKIEALKPPVLQLNPNLVAPPVEKPAPAPPKLSDQIKSSRQDLLLGAMVHQSMGKEIGLAFDDKMVKRGQKIQYILRAIGAKEEELPENVAETVIVVGEDPQPPTPTKFIAAQIDEDSVELRWQRLSDKEEEPFGLASYNITRVDAKNANPLKLNDLPILIPEIPTPQGHVEPVTFYHDDTVAVGRVQYRLVMVDIFGRESEPAILDMNMEDWFTPRNIEQASAELRGNDVQVSWLQGAEAGIKYRVYRIDTEIPNAKPELITLQPIDGTVIPPAGMLVTDKLKLAVAVSNSNYQVKLAKKRSVDENLRAARGEVQFSKLKAIKFIDEIPKAPVWLSFRDVNVPKDKYYRYLVTAVFTRNNRDSVSTGTDLVPVPLLTKPAPPTNARFTFTASGPGRGVTEVGERNVPVQQFQLMPKQSITVKNKKYDFDNIKTQIVKYIGILPDYGGTVKLDWNAVNATKDMQYKIYRANASGYFPADGRFVDTDERQVPGINKVGNNLVQVNPKLNVKLDNTNFVQNQKLEVLLGKEPLPLTSVFQNQNLKAMKVNMDLAVDNRLFKYFERYQAIPMRQFGLEGSVKNVTTFSERTDRSQAHYYTYRIAAVNRWGVEGDPVEVEVRVPATLPPSVPSLLTVRATPQGEIAVDVRANVDSEEVTTYRVFRREVVPTQTIVPFKFEAVLLNATNTTTVQPTSAIVSTVKPIAPVFNNNSPLSSSVKLNFGGRSLVSEGEISERTGSGASRFGGGRKQSALAGLAQNIVNVKGNPAALSVFNQLSNLSGYTEVGQIKVNLADKQNGGTVSFTDRNVVANQEYLYRVVAENSDRIRSDASVFMDATPFKVSVAAPSGFSSSVSGAAIRLQWSAVPDVIGYIVRRSGTAGSFVPLTGIRPELNYVDFSVIPGRTYSYQVIAVDKYGNVSDPAALAGPVVGPTPP